MGGDPDTPALNPDAWTQVVDEHFTNLNAWTEMDNYPFWSTLLQAANANLIEGGGLRLTASDELSGEYYPGAQIYSNTKYLYGYFEIRCKQPPEAVGVWTAFWLWHELNWGWQNDEIDVMEYFGKEPGREQVGEWINGSKTNGYITTGDISSDYHTYACRWRPGEAKYYFDGALYIVHIGNIPAISCRMFIWNGTGGSGGTPDPNVFPVDFDVDYVKVWQETE